MELDRLVNVKLLFILVALIPCFSRCEDQRNATSNVTLHNDHKSGTVNLTSATSTWLKHEGKVHTSVSSSDKKEHTQNQTSVPHSKENNRNLNTDALKNHTSHSSPLPKSLEPKANITLSSKSWMEGGGSIHTVQTKTLNPSSPLDHKNSSESSAVHKNISARKGAPVDAPKNHSSHPAKHTNHKNVSVQLPVIRPKPPKPLFTMVQGDKIMKESESFIESPTTGRDYVLPIVLVIFAVPGFIFLVKFLYKRGTEFTERQQYHRMYLIDGEGCTSLWEWWRRMTKNIFQRETYRTVDLCNIGDISLNPRMNYQSF